MNDIRTTLLNRFRRRRRRPAIPAAPMAGIALVAMRIERRAEAMLGDLQELRTHLTGIDRHGEPA